MDGKNNGHPIKMDDLGGPPLFLETTISCPQIESYVLCQKPHLSNVAEVAAASVV